MRDSSGKTAQFQFDGQAQDIDDIFGVMERTALDMRQPITLEPLETLPRGLPYRYGKFRGNRMRLVRVLGAAGEADVPETKLKVMTDHYTADTRKTISDLVDSDPIIAPAMLFRRNSIFEHGFKLKLKLASQFDPDTGRELTPEQVQEKMQAEEQNYLKILAQLSTWKDDKKMESLAKDLESVSVPQGKAAALILPGIMDLQPGKLPHLVEIITAEDLGDPIVDVGFTRQMVACKLNLDDKPIARADELVYLTRGIRGLRREAKFHGTSPFMPILQISKAVKRYYNLDAPLAMITAYITRLLLKVRQEGDTTALGTRVQTFMNKLFKASNWAVAMPEWYDGVDTVQPKVDWAMFSGIEDKFANVELAQLGVPKSTQNREQNLNRDTATIEAIQYVRFTRNPAENDIKEALETQLFNPLLAHLVGRPLEQIPVRIEIERIVPPEGDIEAIYDRLSVMQTKNEEVAEASLVQDDAKSPFGAAGKKLLVRETEDGYTVERAS